MIHAANGVEQAGDKAAGLPTFGMPPSHGAVGCQCKDEKRSQDHGVNFLAENHKTDALYGPKCTQCPECIGRKHLGPARPVDF